MINFSAELRKIKAELANLEKPAALSPFITHTAIRIYLEPTYIERLILRASKYWIYKFYSFVQVYKSILSDIAFLSSQQGFLMRSHSFVLLPCFIAVIPSFLWGGCYRPSFAESTTCNNEDSCDATSTAGPSTSATSTSEIPASETSTSVTSTEGFCGDGNIDLEEACDDEAQNGLYGFCKSDCTGLGPSCGDGELHELEQCDDGNTNPYDACDNSCQHTCGNGILDEMAGEECDQGELNDDANECTSTCKLNICGDELIFLGIEECDDGINNTNTSECTSECKLNICGDGFALAEMEECDDGNNMDGDACSKVCTRTVKEIVAGSNHNCALFANESIRCWGNGQSGKLGNGNPNDIGDNLGEMPSAYVEVGGVVMQTDAGDGHTCALLTSGKTRCWGYGQYGQLGYGSTNNIGSMPDQMPPADVKVDLTRKIVHIANGRNHTCALLEDGNVRCWGMNSYGQLGYGNMDYIGDQPDEMPPVKGDINLNGVAKQLVAGGEHNCVLLGAGIVRCWGKGDYGQLGYNSTSSIGDNPNEMPPKDVNVGGIVVQLAAGLNHTCALLNSGHVRCWGYGKDGQLGYDSTDNIGNGQIPMPPPNINVEGKVVQIAAGSSSSHICVLLDSGKIKCWGRNDYGQLGYGNTKNIGDGNVPMPPPDVDVGESVIQITTGFYHTCALLESGNARCWGLGSNGQLGYNNKSSIGDDEVPSVFGFVPLF